LEVGFTLNVPTAAFRDCQSRHLCFPVLFSNNTTVTMAILAHPRLTAQIVVDGQPLLEYDDEDAVQDPTVVTKYIEAQAGSEFQIHYSHGAIFPFDKDIRVRCYIDGAIVHGKVLRAAKRVQDRVRKIEGTTEKNGLICMLQRFRFNDLAIGKYLFSTT
jgi:hypothetical protein